MIRSRNILLSLKPLKYSVIFKTSLILTHRMSTEIEEAHLVICAERKSMPVDVQEGKTYYWCSCGRSTKQPFCDGSHKGTDFTPIAYTATETKKAYFCGCKQSSNKPLCDGSHKKLPEDAQGKGFSVDYCAKLV